MAISFKKIINSITGISTPVFGISWNPSESDRDIVRKLFLFIEDKRVLYYPYNMEIPHYVVESILEIRKYLTNEILNLSEKSEILPHFRALRATCRKYLDIQDNVSNRRFRMAKDEMLALGELRASFGIHIARLSVKYGIDVEDELEIILPIEDID